MRTACLLALITLVLFTQALSAQDGAAIWKERSDSCHDAPVRRATPFSAIKAMSGEGIYVALTTGAMKSQAQGLSTPQLFALVAYSDPTNAANAPSLERTCKGDSSISAAAFKASMNAPRWNGWSTD